MGRLTENLTPPYYEAVLKETQEGLKDKNHVAPSDEMVTLATRQHGFLGLETARDKKGKQITVSYWKDVDAIEGWINACDEKINHRFGIGLADTCGIDITLIDEYSHVEPAPTEDDAPKGLRAFAAAAVASLLGFVS
jgi:heme-degrading monooxygenase HmoA